MSAGVPSSQQQWATLGKTCNPWVVPAAPGQYVSPGQYQIAPTSQAALERILKGGS